MSIMNECYMRVQADRVNWNKPAIGANAAEGKAFELPFRNKVNLITPYLEEYEASVKLNQLDKLESLLWRLSLSASPDGHMASNDHSLDFECSDRRVVSLGRIESECRTGGDDWGDNLPSKYVWTRGLSLLVRKNYLQNLFFVKHNKSKTSAFCVECGWLQSKVNRGEIVPKKVVNSLSRKGVVTCDIMYAIPWDMVPGNLYDIHNNRAGGIAFVEKNRWEDMWIFVLDKLECLDDAFVPDWGKLEGIALGV